MPLRCGTFWLDWDNAVSIVGHDIEVKETYESIIRSGAAAPELFIDIGANYGTHSLLFLAHGIETMTFEPNSTCHACFERMCKLNHVSPNLEPVALGDRAGYVELLYPNRDTWLGSTNKDVIDRLLGSDELVSERVEQRTLDDYFGKIGSKRALIKIDTEGNELSVLNGARKILDEVKPTVIFECFSDEEKIRIFKLFAAGDYSIYPLPWDPKREAEVLGEGQFMTSSDTNFIAVPGVGG